MKRAPESNDVQSPKVSRDARQDSTDLPPAKKCKLDILAHLAELSSDEAKTKAKHSSEESGIGNVAATGKKATSKKKAHKSVPNGTNGAEKKSMKSSTNFNRQAEKKALSGTRKVKSSKGAVETQAVGSQKKSTFPEKIMELLENGLATDAIWWLQDGQTIALEPENFSKSKIINTYFEGNKLDSFKKKLKKWGFKPVDSSSVSEKTLTFSHVLFEKKSPHLARQIKMESAHTKPRKTLAHRTGAVEKVETSPMPTPVLSSRKETLSAPRQPTSPPGAKPKTVPTLESPISGERKSSFLQNQERQVSALAAQSILAQQGSDLANSILGSFISGQQLEIQQQQAQHVALQQAQHQALMQTLLAEQQRSSIAAIQQQNSNEVLLQAIVAEEQRKQALLALQPDILLRDRLLQASAYAQPQQLGLQQLLGHSPGGSILDQLAVLQAGQQSRDHNAAFLEQLMLLQQQRGL